MDVLMCAGPTDVHGLFPVALRLVDQHCPWLRRVHVVTPAPELARSALSTTQAALHKRVMIHADHDVAGTRAMSLPGWFRQQYIKLHADMVCDTEKFVCVGADTLVLDPVVEDDLIRDELPLLRYFRYEQSTPHLNFERTRVRNVARQLAVEPSRALPPGDFICDVFPMAATHLRCLRTRLDALYGPGGLTELLERFGQRRGPDNRTGEWTMYAVFILDVLAARPQLRLAGRDWAVQIHTPADMARPGWHAARIIHFVHEPGGARAVLAHLVAAGRLGRETLDPLGSVADAHLRPATEPHDL